MSKPKFKEPLNNEELDYLAQKFKLLGEPMRLRILQSICFESKTVNEIVEAIGSTQANISKHLSLLAAADILDRKKVGQCVHYKLKDKLVVQLCNMVRESI